jgi:hypothetical protein
MPSQHPLDDVADELLDWLQTESAYYVEALKGGHRAPFAAPVNEQQKTDYYTRQVFNTNKDGSINYDSPNVQGRDELLKRMGVQGYTEVIRAVMPKTGMQNVVPEAAPEAATPTDELDQEA